jgi:hypothetical protein
MRALLTAGLMLVSATLSARADDLVVTRPGVMCSSAQALAALTLPDGDSRTHRDASVEKYAEVARKGECRDLQIGQKLGVVKMFRNTAIVSLRGDTQEDNADVFVAPVIDLGSVLAPPVAAAAIAPVVHENPGIPRNPVSDTIMDVPIGMTQVDFVRLHGDGKCIDSADGGLQCSYSGANKADCPGEYACYATVYEFLHGVLVAFHTQLVSQVDWVQLYRLTLATFASPMPTTQPWGNAISFNTNTGVLMFAHKIGPPQSWHVTLSYRPASANSR